MKKVQIFEILRELGALEVRQPANLQGSKASKLLEELFSKQNSIHETEFICFAAAIRERGAIHR
jgi:hypothetical protein